MKKKKKKLFAALADKYKDSRLDPGCPYFGICGGCSFRNISYENQLLLKKEYLNGLFEGILEVPAVVPSEALQYRNRMDMVSAFGRLGLRQAGSYKFVVDIGSCAIMQEKMNRVYGLACGLLKKIEGYDYLLHQGFLRYAVLRQGWYTGELMLNLVVAKDQPLPDELFEVLSDECDSMSVLIYEGLADLSYGPVLKNIKGGAINEVFDGIKYKISPNSFFQSNSPVALSMYKRIRGEVSGRTLDLFCGLGSISLYVSSVAECVTGVECLAEAVEGADVNRVLNGIENTSFVRADAAEFFREKGTDFDTIILDPPRSGLHPSLIKHINLSGPGKIIYMSCNPAAFRIEAGQLDSYEISSFEAYDMFPYTPHIETLAVLTRRKG